ncbi:MAG: NUDIX hydrolase [Alphaproteobacteria bacterium]
MPHRPAAPAVPESREYPSRPFVGVGAVVLRGDEVLLVRRARPPRAGRWSIPGGAQELGETWAEAARREVLEEAGVDIAVTGLLDVIDAITRDDDGRVRLHYTLVDVAAEWLSGVPVGGDDADDARFVALDSLDDYELWSETVRIIRLAVAHRDGR